MQYSIINGHRIKATPKLIGMCPVCNAPTRSKCGNINLWHWAHITFKHCDSWWETESEWHRNWKNNFAPECQEVVHQDELTGERHIADIKTQNGLVIELQHSTISIEELEERESYYKNMIWLVDARSFRDRFTIHQNKLPAPGTELHRDFRLNEDGTVFRLISAEWFGSGYTKKYQQEKYDWYLNKSYQGHHFFEWVRPRKIWLLASKPIFLDFGSDQLYELQHYPDYYRRCVRVHSKLAFIEQHKT